MRELNATGFMHNRVRMIVAMFLTTVALAIVSTTSSSDRFSSTTKCELQAFQCEPN
jgi:tRNA U38,U39,U40 pseudouridine synthase TruA